MRTFLSLSGLAALLSAAVVAAPAPAGAAEPAPTPDCGVMATDKAGDNVNATTQQQAPPNTDVTQVFFRHTIKDGKPRVTANIRVAELTKAIQAPYTAHQYILDFTINKQPKLVAAIIDRAGGVSYYYGHPRAITDTDPAPSFEGYTTGALYEGKDGIVEIEVPLEAWKVPAGAAISALTFEVRQPVGRTSQVIPAPIVYVSPIADDGAGKGSFAIAPCATPGTPTPAAPITAPVDAGTPPPAAAPKLTVTAPKLVARKVSKARRFSVKLSSSAPLTGVVGQLKAGSRVLAAGKLASLGSSGAMTLKLTKKLKRGTYTLAFSGRDAAGQTAAAAVAVKVR